MNGYKELSVKGRVIQERNELEIKIGRLSAFIGGDSDTYRELPLMEKEQLHLQKYLMDKYHNVLQNRIAYMEEAGYA